MGTAPTDVRGRSVFKACLVKVGTGFAEKTRSTKKTKQGA